MAPPRIEIEFRLIIIRGPELRPRRITYRKRDRGKAIADLQPYLAALDLDGPTDRLRDAYLEFREVHPWTRSSDVPPAGQISLLETP